MPSPPFPPDHDPFSPAAHLPCAHSLDFCDAPVGLGCSPRSNANAVRGALEAQKQIEEAIERSHKIAAAESSSTDPLPKDPVPPKPKLDHHELEEGSALALDWSKLTKVAAADCGVVPVVVQHDLTNEVLIVAYANEEALRESLSRGLCCLWSTSRNELWVKGATSGDALELKEVRVNCEQNSLLYRVVPCGAGACHTKGPEGKSRPTCYYRRLLPGDRLEGCQQERAPSPIPEERAPYVSPRCETMSTDEFPYLRACQEEWLARKKSQLV